MEHTPIVILIFKILIALQNGSFQRICKKNITLRRRWRFGKVIQKLL
jgi:hypothetical protein